MPTYSLQYNCELARTSAECAEGIRQQYEALKENDWDLLKYWKRASNTYIGYITQLPDDSRQKLGFSIRSDISRGKFYFCRYSLSVVFIWLLFNLRHLLLPVWASETILWSTDEYEAYPDGDFAQNYHYTDQKIRRLDDNLKKHHVRDVTWLSPCVCALAYYKKESGIVIDIGSKYAAFGIAHQGKEVDLVELS
jgi:hypothetical protein